VKFTHSELISIEHTVERMYTVTRTLTGNQSVDTANLRAMSYIISVMRHSADLIEHSEMSAGYKKTLELFATN
jgi:hypothetical protein